MKIAFMSITLLVMSLSLLSTFLIGAAFAV